MVHASLDRRWFERDAPDVAAGLLNKLLTVEVDGVVCSARIIETEAYLAEDPASHSFNGETARNSVMFGPAGHLYVYLSYGIHQCANVVTGQPGDGQAVLLRAVKPIDGVDAMVRRRGRTGRELANGPGKLCQAMGIGAALNGMDMLAGGVVTIIDDGVDPPAVPMVGPRVGITKAVEVPWRFRVPAASHSSGVVS